MYKYSQIVLVLLTYLHKILIKKNNIKKNPLNQSLKITLKTVIFRSSRSG